MTDFEIRIVQFDDIQMASTNRLRKVGPGKQKIKCVKVCEGKFADIPDAGAGNVWKPAQLIWMDSETVVLFAANGQETQFHL